MKNDSTITSELLYAKDGSKKHLIFEKKIAKIGLEAKAIDFANIASILKIAKIGLEAKAIDFAK